MNKILITLLVLFLSVSSVQALPARPVRPTTSVSVTATYSSYYGELKSSNQYVTLSGLGVWTPVTLTAGDIANFSFGASSLIANLGSAGKYQALLTGSVSSYASAEYQVGIFQDGELKCANPVKISANDIDNFAVSCVLNVDNGDEVSVKIQSTGSANPTVNANLVLSRI